MPAATKTAVIAGAAVAVLILHILAGTMVQRASSAGSVTPAEEPRPSSYD
jgi:hypothetical protein